MSPLPLGEGINLISIIERGRRDGERETHHPRQPIVVIVGQRREVITGIAALGAL
jgi:hypothetical protein